MSVTDRMKNHQGLLTSLLRILRDKYQSDPEGFRGFLPEVAQTLDSLSPRPVGQTIPFALTDRERDRRVRSFDTAVQALNDDGIERSAAIRAAEDYAVLTLDNRVPLRLDSEKRAALAKAAVGKNPGSFRAKETIVIQDGSNAPPACSVPLIRGVGLNLTWDMKLVSISVLPERIRERKRLLEFVGAGKDDATNVAERHDEYLGEMSPRGAA